MHKPVLRRFPTIAVHCHGGNVGGPNIYCVLQLLSSTHGPLLIARATIEPSPLPAPTLPIPTSNQMADPSTTNFNAIFEAASNEYKTLTGQDLETHPFSVALEDYPSPNSILNVFRRQARAFDTFRKGDDKLMEWLTPIVYIFFSISETLGKRNSLVSTQPFYDDISPATFAFLALLSPKDTPCFYWCSPRSQSFSTFLDCASA